MIMDKIIVDPEKYLRNQSLASKVPYIGYDAFNELVKAGLLEDGESLLVAVIPKDSEPTEFSHFIRIEKRVTTS